MFTEFIRALRLTGLTISVCVISYTVLVLSAATVIAQRNVSLVWFLGATEKSSVLGLWRRSSPAPSTYGPDHRQSITMLRVRAEAICLRLILRFANGQE